MHKTLETLEETLSQHSLEEKLILLSNCLFNLYPELKKADTLKGIEAPEMRLPENYAELEEVYSFNKGAAVFLVLNAAHDLLLAT